VAPVPAWPSGIRYNAAAWVSASSLHGSPFGWSTLRWVWDGVWDADDPNLLTSLNAMGSGYLPELIGYQVVAAGHGELSTRLDVRQDLMAPNGYLHAATVVALADTSCGYGTRLSLPDGATNFTTIELKANFLGTVREGAIACEARLIHGGRMTQVWDATVRDERTGKVLTLFRCTQAMLSPR
jgi:1,4-dihydroxy-2-naphthoyl-CoA hydrolase